ncbi:MAG: cysteine dioxygenase family protein [Flavobacteriales bacterium]|nr:cysteine dioxygenase family protein [Flavobacteriales bacterium]
MSDSAIHTVDELVRILMEGPGRKGYLHILERVAIPAEDLAPLCRWNPKHYTRNCIARTDDFELLLICYEPDQRTSIHDFATEEAWVHPVIGSVVEERFEPASGKTLRKAGSAKLDKDSYSYLHNGRSIHRYTNSSGERAVTLNLYARPLRTWKVYDERSGETRSRPAGS